MYLSVDSQHVSACDSKWVTEGGRFTPLCYMKEANQSFIGGIKLNLMIIQVNDISQ